MAYSKFSVANRYGIAPNSLLYNPNISFKAKGLWTYLQSKPDGWDFSAERIANEAQDGVTAIYSALHELEENGYLIRKKEKNDKGHFDYEYILLCPENKVSKKVGNNDLPNIDEPTFENLSMEKLRYNKEVYSKQESSKKEREEAHSILDSNLFRKPNIPTKQQVLEAIVNSGGNKEMAKSFYEKHDSTGWFINGSPIVNYVSLASRFVQNWKNNEEKQVKKERTEPTAPPLTHLKAN